MGGVGAPDGWTAVLVRNARAARLVRDAVEAGALERGPALDLMRVDAAAERKLGSGLGNGGRALPFDGTPRAG